MKSFLSSESAPIVKLHQIILLLTVSGCNMIE